MEDMQMGNKKKERKRPTADERMRNEDYRLKHFSTDTAIEWGKRDPDIGRQIMAGALGLKIPDQVERSRSKLLAAIEEKAVRRLEEDPALTNQVIDAYIRKVVEEAGFELEGGELRRKPTLQHSIRIAREVGELKEAMGIKDPSFLDVLKEPGVIIAVIGLLSALFGLSQPATPGTENVSVKEDGNGAERLEGLRKLIDQQNAKSSGGKKKVDSNNKGRHKTTPTEQDNPGKAEEGDGKVDDTASGK